MQTHDFNGASHAMSQPLGWEMIGWLAMAMAMI